MTKWFYIIFCVFCLAIGIGLMIYDIGSFGEAGGFAVLWVSLSAVWAEGVWRSKKCHALRERKKSGRRAIIHISLYASFFLV